VPALEVVDLTVQFEGQDRPAVDSVSFAVQEGTIAVLIGPNGSGKSTVLRAILGLVPVRSPIPTGRSDTRRSGSRSIRPFH
jgi:ABC-type Mn2+/Zn2+ transport system ATPase subunit